MLELVAAAATRSRAARAVVGSKEREGEEGACLA